LLSYIGLQGEKNRQKLADTFLRPTTWRQYCLEVSNTTCQQPDEVAIRPPRGLYAVEGDDDYDEEADSYFTQDLFAGYFRKTDRNFGNATHPATGHFIDYGCQWTSYAEQQFYHLNIPLSGDTDYQEGKRGYPGSQMPQILQAANATKSPIIIMWALPDPFYQSLIGTDMELHAIIFPPVTQECLEYKRPHEQNCVASREERVGDARGACEQPPVALHKAVSTSLYGAINDPGIDVAARSPALDAIQLFTVTSPIYGSWFDTIREMDAMSSKKRTLMRDAVCHWAVKNYEKTLQRFVPHSYPRVIQDGEENSVLEIAAIVLSVLSIIAVLVADLIVEKFRHRRVIRLAQIEFLRFLLTGLFLMSMGALMSALPPTNGICSATIWFVNVGYTIELAPLLVKVAAINRLTTASQRMQKVVIKRQSLFRWVAVITSLIVLFLIVWEAIDAPKRHGELSLSSSMTQHNETIVYRSYYCSSDSDIWLYVAFGWTFMLLISSTVLAVQMRNVRQEFNESQTLGIMTYSHFVFAVLRFMTFFLSDGLGEASSARYRSILISVDAAATLVIYFLPKFMVLRVPDTRSEGFETPQSSRHSDCIDNDDNEDSSSRLESANTSSSVRFVLPNESADGEKKSSDLSPIPETKTDDANNMNASSLQQQDESSDRRIESK
jgi:7 transmembrane sweet-taste receptor of 3 GCPR